MSIEKKTKLIYSIEIGAISLIPLVIAILRLVGVMKPSDRRLLIYNIITLIGGIWMIIDFVWCLLSERKRAKNSMLDKILVLPMALFLIVFDIICFAQRIKADTPLVLIGVSIALFYLFAIYLFESVYHYFKPIPAIMEAIKEAEKQTEIKEENKENDGN